MRRLNNSISKTIYHKQQSSTAYRLIQRILLLVVLTFTLGLTAQAEPLTITFADPVGDHTGAIDVTSMSLAFDNTTGDYTIILMETTANPFVGHFRVNINLYNP